MKQTTADLVQRFTFSYRRIFETGSTPTGQAVQDPEQNFAILLVHSLYFQTFYTKVNSADLKVILQRGVFNGWKGHTLDLEIIEAE